MINPKNKTIAFLLSGFLCLSSWGLIFINVILRVATLFNVGLTSIDMVGFTLTTILISIYTLVILFKISSYSYFPLILVLLHMSTLNGSSIAIVFILIDLIILFLLNTGASPQTTSQSQYYYTNTNQNSAQPKHNIDDDNVFDAEYHTKD